jgi:ATP-dependent Clp protease ATP-binding subunit ClpA
MTNILATFLEINTEDMESPGSNKELEKAIEDKFLTSSKFSLEIEKIVTEEGCNHIDAIVMFCEKNEIDIETITKLVSKPLKERLKYDAINLNFIKQTSKARLPL